MSNEVEIRELLAQHKQEHLLQFWDELNETEKETLLNDIVNVNLNETVKYFEKVNQTHHGDTKSNLILEPVPHQLHGSLKCTDKETLDSYREIGLKEISEGHVGVLLLAGGQGTRLGVPYPKGMFNVELPSKKTLFQLQAERILKLQRLADEKYSTCSIIMWYIMTSPATTKMTHEFLEKHKYFGLDKKNVLMFEQGVLPCFNFEGKILMDSKFKIAKSPDGNGGLYKALKENEILHDMEKKNIKYLHAYCVDNILVRVADPVFIGYCITKGAECAAKVVEKVSPTEPIGVVCKVNKKLQVVEYSEISNFDANRKNDDGRLTFSAGNICNHFFTREFLEKVANQFESEMKLHRAKKKIPYIDGNGKLINPTDCNGVKIEKFIFDVFVFASDLNFVIWEVPRDEEFSALKNSIDSNEDNPHTARESIFKLHKKFIENAGGQVTVNGAIEISPLISYGGEGLESKCKGQIFKPPVLLFTQEEEGTQGAFI
ncbi:hypothetical protein RUM43_013851 [Polyplax serrata]|uniref:UDP-N-acetylglucosamine diphosphorylase n=1 Tax=Polyplax serrata TaxID=468196 RepID=A0AAN8PRC0_POLSC